MSSDDGSPGTGAGADRAARKAQRRAGRRRRPLWRRLLMWFALAVVGLVAAGLLAFIIAYQMIDIPDANEDFQTETSYVYFADGKTELGEFELQNRQPVPLTSVPQSLQDAVIAAEDRTFYDNS